jgi:uncharacterized protein (DUF2147 family)
MKSKWITAALALLAPAALVAQASGVLGDWMTPGGDTVRVDRCGPSVCLWILALGPTAPATTDAKNPDSSLRSRPLCGLRIGSAFYLRDPDHAAGGSLYDPKSGRTYSGQMTAQGSELHLRGYVMLSIFGRSETWTRAQAPPNACRLADSGK